MLLIFAVLYYFSDLPYSKLMDHLSSTIQFKWSSLLVIMALVLLSITVFFLVLSELVIKFLFRKKNFVPKESQLFQFNTLLIILGMFAVLPLYYLFDRFVLLKTLKNYNLNAPFDFLLIFVGNSSLIIFLYTNAWDYWRLKFKQFMEGRRLRCELEETKNKKLFLPRSVLSGCLPLKNQDRLKHQAVYVIDLELD